jgi:hypothetical protein
MAVYGLDFGTTTTYLTNGSTGEVIPIPLGVEEKKAAAVDSFALFSRVKASSAGLEVGAKDGTRSLKRMLDGGDRGSLSKQEVQKYIGAIFSRVIELAKTKGGIDLTQPDSVRLGCPAAWAREPRVELLEIAARAGLGLVKNSLVEEPVAAGVAWVQQNIEAAVSPGLTLVFDMGGGTLDIAVLDIQKTASDPLVFVLASGGNKFAGDTVDECLFDILSAKSSIESNDVSGALTSIEDAKKLFSLSSASTSVKVQLVTGSNETVDFTKADLEKAYSVVISAGNLLLEDALREAYLWDLLRHAGIGPQAQKPGNPYPIEDSFYAPQTTSGLIDEANEIPIDQLWNSVTNVVLAGGMSNSPIIQSHLRGMFKKAAFYLGVSPLDKSTTHSASRVIAAGLGDPEEFSGLNFARPNFDILVGGVIHFRAFESLLGGVPQSSPVLRKVRPLAGSGNVEIRYPGQSRAIPLRGRDGTQTLSHSTNCEISCDCRTILYPDGEFVGFDSTGRRFETSIDEYMNAGFAKRGYALAPSGREVRRYDRDTDDIDSQKSNRAKMPRCEHGVVNDHFEFREDLSSYWLGVKYLKDYLKVLDVIRKASSISSGVTLWNGFAHGTSGHSCDDKWLAFWSANVKLLGWKPPQEIEEDLVKFSARNEVKQWTNAW